jgi:hypothetical protein
LGQVDLNDYFASAPPDAETPLLTLKFYCLLTWDVDKRQIAMNNALPWVGTNSWLWKEVMLQALDVNPMVQLEAPALASIEDFLFTKQDLSEEWQTLLVKIGTRNEVTRQRWLHLAERRELTHIQSLLINNLDDYLHFIGVNPVAFRVRLMSFIEDRRLKDILMNPKYRDRLMAISSEDYADVAWEVGGLTFVRSIATSMLSDQRLAVHFFHFFDASKNKPAFLESATQQELRVYMSSLARYYPERVLEFVKMLTVEPGPYLNECTSRGIVDASLYICEVTGDREVAKEFAARAIEAKLLDGREDGVVDEVIRYLAGLPEDGTDSWIDCLKAFQLPVFKFLNQEYALVEVLRHLGKFLDAMIPFRAVTGEWTRDVANAFVTSFGFLPLRHARPIMVRMFKSIHEKGDFTATLQAIIRDQAITNQSARIKALNDGLIIDATHCLVCGKKLGEGDAITPGCGHAIHERCRNSGVCPVRSHCKAKFDDSFVEQQRATWLDLA